MASPTQQFEHGCYRTTETKQLIAFWTHTIDTFVSVLEHFENVYNDGIQLALEASKTDEPYSYMGAVRAGFNKSIQALPVNVKGPVEIYFAKRLERCKEIVPEDVLDIDLLLGTGDPFRFET